MRVELSDRRVQLGFCLDEIALRRCDFSEQLMCDCDVLGCLVAGRITKQLTTMFACALKISLRQPVFGGSSVKANVVEAPVIPLLAFEDSLGVAQSSERLLSFVTQYVVMT